MLYYVRVPGFNLFAFLYVRDEEDTFSSSLIDLYHIYYYYYY